MTTKLHKAYRLNKKTYYYHKCDCGNTFTTRDDKKPKSCGCLQGRPKSVDIETNTNNVEIIPKTHKRCYMCKELLSLDSFHKRCSKCKECTKTYNKQWQEENRDKSREYNYKHRLRVLGLTEEEKRIRRRINKHQRRLREKNGGPKATPKQIIELKKRQKNRCYWCYTDISKAYHQDHYIALKNFGDNSIDNIVLTCPKCNMSKGKKSPLEFANKKGRLL